VLDGVGVIRACLFEKLLEVVRGQSCLALAVACGICGVHRVGAVYLLIDATVVIDGGLLVALLAPLLSGFGALLSTLDSNTAPSFYDSFRGVSRRMERS
jgi:hypothetical protein